MRLTARSEYGLLAMIDLATHAQDGPASARELSERQAIPTKFLEQLLSSLRRAELVQATRGARGGFTLARMPSEITVLDVVEALEGPLQATICDSDRGNSCGRSGVCAAASVWNRATHSLREVFASTTLEDLAVRQLELDSVENAEGSVSPATATGSKG